ncbi:mechanosensitive ion channel family protein [Neosynechococcus sphagnicola]|uniref:mechanosensitive ion channel family protein n=1 Tax=Neosynechococcus sphagnicola TaxID=1501145 RepID=UPI0023BAFF82|nr:mechanosensitive ion channel domain-containing protein [Neosynechococcus sphagnicola]
MFLVTTVDLCMHLYLWQLPLDRFLQTPWFKIGKESVTLTWLLQITLAFLGVVIFSRLLKHFLKERLLTRLDQGNREAVAVLISYSTAVLGLIILLQMFGFDVATLTVILGTLGIGIGFGLQEMTKHLVSGLVLLLEGKLQVGDYVEFDGLSGYIKEISIRSTLIHTFDGGVCGGSQ